MAQEIPRPSFLEVPDFFSLLDSPRNRFGSSRSLPKFAEDLESTEFSFWALKYEKNENFRKFSEIC